MIEPIFKQGDYIINRAAGDIAIVDKITKKGYYHFKKYYCALFNELVDAKNPTRDLQINYQKFWDLCNDEEIKQMNEIIKVDN